jgi:hypothetical protein
LEKKRGRVRERAWNPNTGDLLARTTLGGFFFLSRASTGTGGRKRGDGGKRRARGGGREIKC